MPLVIAHRGASGYPPEHTLEAKTLAFEMGADYLEQDIVASRDDQLLVLHDVHLDRVSDVATKFPDRQRPDGRYYVRDFDLAEIKTLRAWERMNADGSAVYPERYPVRTGEFGFNTLGEELELVRRLNERGAEVQVVLTRAARRFVTPLSFQALSGRAVSAGATRQACGQREPRVPGRGDASIHRVRSTRSW